MVTIIVALVLWYLMGFIGMITIIFLDYERELKRIEENPSHIPAYMKWIGENSSISDSAKHAWEVDKRDLNLNLKNDFHHFLMILWDNLLWPRKIYCLVRIYMDGDSVIGLLKELYYPDLKL